jgi:hypothetical protein
MSGLPISPGSRQHVTIRHTDTSEDPVTIRIYAMEMNEIRRAVAGLEEKVKEKSGNHVFNRPDEKKFITKMDQSHVGVAVEENIQFRYMILVIINKIIKCLILQLS